MEPLRTRTPALWLVRLSLGVLKSLVVGVIRKVSVLSRRLADSPSSSLTFSRAALSVPMSGVSSFPPFRMAAAFCACTWMSLPRI